MLSRLSQLSRHVSRPASSFATRSAPLVRAALGPSIMTSSAALGGMRPIETAACLIIGDEILGGKTLDTNSNFFAKWCFRMGISLKSIEVIGDEEAEIIEATKRMSSKYDLVITSGGIGPTHDDITYESIAKAFDLPLVLHDGAYERMKRIMSQTNPGFNWDEQSQQLERKLRMIRLPIDHAKEDGKQVLFVDDDLWVPVSVVNGNVHILPGVPSLFMRLLLGLRRQVPEGKAFTRLLVATEKSESSMAEYLEELAARLDAEGVKVGSYPTWGKEKNIVSLVGRNRELMESLIPEVEKNLDGERVARGNEWDDLIREVDEAAKRRRKSG